MAKTKPDAPAADQTKPDAPAADELVAMVRDADQFPPPHTADVHPDEVDNFRAGGWRLPE